MKAPDKIYLQVCGDCELNDCDNCIFKDLEDNVTWSKDRVFPRDIEYIHADAFIEKAVKWLEENLSKETSVIASGVVNIDFRNVIEKFKTARL